MPSRCERNVMFSKAHEASFHGHFANLPVEVCSPLNSNLQLQLETYENSPSNQ
jgi:hypothetical protein